nr:unnamed protein product [Callosobruchus chinensis]
MNNIGSTGKTPLH